MKLLNNCYLNPELKNELFKLENHKRRVNDFEQLVKFYLEIYLLLRLLIKKLKQSKKTLYSIDQYLLFQ